MVVQINKVNIPMEQLGLQNVGEAARDPYDINKHLQPGWNTIIGEPEGLQSPAWAWKLSSELFSFIQAATYRVLVTIFAPILSIFVAINFGILNFLQIWFLRPLLKFFHIVFTFVRSFLELVLFGVLGPVVETFGLICSKAKLRHQRVYDVKEEPSYPFTI